MSELSREQFQRAKQAFTDAIERPKSERADLIARSVADDGAVMRLALRMLAMHEADPDGTLGTVELTREQLGEAVAGRAPNLVTSEEVPTQTTCPKCGAPGPPGATACPVDWEVLVDSKTTIAGKTLDGVYKIEERLGKGGMGSVYAAEHKFLETRVAIKVISSEYAMRPDFVERFKREGKCAMAVDHPNVVKIYELKPSTDGILYMVLEYVEGETLTKLLRRRRCLNLEEAIELLAPLGAALDAAHEAGVVHRDLKPDNIMISSRDGRPFVKLMDLGIASLRRPQATPATDLTQLTSPGVVIGTPGYMSPEQMRSPGSGDLVIDSRADVYSLGVVFFEVLNGCRPFDDRSPSPIAPLPDAVSEAIRRAMSQTRHERQSSAGEFVAEIRRAASNDARKPVAADIGTRVTVASPAPDDTPRSLRIVDRRIVLAVSAAVVVVVVVISAVGVREWGRSPDVPVWSPVIGVSEAVRREALTFWFEARTSNGRDWIPVSGPVPTGIEVRLQFASPEPGHLYLVAPIGEEGEYRALLTDLDYDGEAANTLIPGRVLSCKQSIQLGTQQPETRFLVVLSTDPIEDLPSLNRKPEARLSANEMAVIESLLAKGRNRHVSLVDGVVDGKTVTIVSVEDASAGSPSTVAFELIIRPEPAPRYGEWVTGVDSPPT